MPADESQVAAQLAARRRCGWASGSRGAQGAAAVGL